MAANSSLNLTSLDFDGIKSNFINFLSSQETFKDYNFAGSNINVLLDVLAYNTYLNAFYLNMVASEMFLDSAQKLDSVISHAKELNYLPRSSRSSVAVISFDIDTVGIASPIIVPKGSIFSGTNSNGSFIYVTTEENYYNSTNTYVDASNTTHTVFSISNLSIYEGSYVQDTFVIDYTNPSKTYTLSNPNIDTDSLSIIVQENGTNSVFTYAENLYGLSNTSNVFFIQATANQQFQILFGDGVFGYYPLNGDIVYANYIITSGSDGTGCTKFNASQNLGTINGGTGNYSPLNVLSSSTGGANAEGIESIRFNGPRYYQTQGRCVTKADYETIILQNFPEIESVNVFTNTIDGIIEYGTVYIAVSTFSGSVLTDSRKADIEQFIGKLGVIGITVKLIDPDYIFITLNSLIHMDFSNTTLTSTGIISNVENGIQSYNTNSLQKFNTAFRLSRLETAINNIDVGILSNETSAKIYKVFSPSLNMPYPRLCNYFNSVIPGTISSSSFISGGKSYIFTDNIAGIDAGTGKIYQYQQSSTSSTPNYTKIGSVDYSTGTININQISFNNIGGGIKIFATPENKDIYCLNNIILEIDITNGINLTTISG